MSVSKSEIERQLGAAKTELEEDQIWAMMMRWDRPETPCLCRRVGTHELVGLGLLGDVGEQTEVVVRVTDLSFADLANARAQRRTHLEGAPDMVVSVGTLAERVFKQLGRNRGLTVPPSNEIPCEGPRLWGVLNAAASEANRRGAIIQLIRRGFLVRKGHVMEIVSFAQADVGLLERALNRVAPLPETD